MKAAIVAIAHNRVIGSKSDLPWYLPADLKRFREITTGHTVIMGRKTYDSIAARLGHALPNRRNIVISRSADVTTDDIELVHSLDEAFALAGPGDVFIIGGAQIYELALPYLDRLYVTEVNADIAGDTFFPVINPTEWQEVSREAYTKDDKNHYDYSYVTLDRTH